VTQDQERWAEALAVIQIHSDAAETFIAGRVEGLASDPAGVERWQEIGRRVAQLRRSGGALQ
jgi:hypothetical protein